MPDEAQRWTVFAVILSLDGGFFMRRLTPRDFLEMPWLECPIIDAGELN